MWQPSQYEKFRNERSQPFADLLAMVERRQQMRVVDLGCGTGEWTAELHDHLAAAQTLGVDNSESMLQKSSAFASERLRFEHCDIEGFATTQPVDLIFSNAALHWVADHARLITRFRGFLAPLGQIAIQMPANDDHPSHSIAASVAAEFGVAAKPTHILPLDEYARLLRRLGFRRQAVRMQIYGHNLESTRSVVEWVRGTLLTDYEKRLGNQFPKFLDTYSDRLISVLGDEQPFFYTYKRVLMWAAL